MNNDFRENNIAVFKIPKGLNKGVVEIISKRKNEPAWMLERRLRAYQSFLEKPMPEWGADLSEINFDEITYYLQPSEKSVSSWDDVPPEVRRTYDKLGIPQAEQKYLAGVGAQYESEVVYHHLQERLEKQGVVFSDIETGLQAHPELVQKYFGTVIPLADNKFAALNTAVWSGGSFIYVPKGVSIDLPLQAYFRINAENMGQFERTLIIADEGSYVHYVEGCLPAGEQVSTGERWVNVESVKPKDFVLDHTGALRRVRAVMTRNYQGTMVTIQPMSPCNRFQLTNEHPLLSISRESVRTPRKARQGWKIEVDTKKLIDARPQWTPAGKIKAGDFLVYPIPQTVHDDAVFSIPWLRLLGYYLAEGSAMIHNKLKIPVVQFSFGHKDRVAIEEVKRLVQSLVGKKTYEVEQKGRHAVNLVVYSKELRERVLEACGKGAATKQLSKTVMELPPKKQQHLLETYYCGDGNICWRGKSELIRCSTASATLARQIQELLARQGFFGQIILRKGGPDVIEGRLIVRKDQYVVAYTPHKKHSQIRQNQYGFLVPIRKIKKRRYAGPVFNFEVEKTNSYLVRGFAVHNCSAPRYASGSLHAAVVEIIALPGSRVRYTTIQNWSTNVYNLVTKRAKAFRNATVEWVDGNLGSYKTMKFPCVILMEPGAHGEVLSLAFAGKGQHLDAGAKMIHLAPHTTSRIISKSVSQGGGRTSYRGLLKITPHATNVRSNVRCDALILDPASRSDTYPTMDIANDEVDVAHEATVSKVGEEQLFYLQSRGLDQAQAEAMIVNGFVEPIVKELPMEYAVEMNRLIQMQMEGSVG